MKNKINVGVFENLVRNYFEYMSKTFSPSAPTILLWYEKISAYLEGDVIKAFDRMKDVLDRVPYNFPKAIKESISVLIIEKGDEKKRIDYGECDQCNKSGFYSIRSFHSGHKAWYQGIRFCGACGNWQNYCNEPGDRVTADSLRAAGAKFKAGNKCLIVSPEKSQGRGSSSKIKQTATRLFHKMPTVNENHQWHNMTADERKNFLKMTDEKENKNDNKNDNKKMA